MRPWRGGQCQNALTSWDQWRDRFHFVFLPFSNRETVFGANTGLTAIKANSSDSSDEGPSGR